MKRALAFGITVLVLAVGSPPSSAAQHAADLTEEGGKLVEAGRYQQALEVLDRAIEEDAEYAMAYFVRGYALNGLGNLAGARDAFLRAAELNPGWADAHQMAAVLAARTGQFETSWTQAIRAHQAGAQVDRLMEQLARAQPGPDDLDRQLEAPRIFVAEADTTKAEAHTDNPFGVEELDEDTNERADALGVGLRRILDSQGDIYRVLWQTRASLAASSNFALVQQADLATFILVVEVDELSASSDPRQMKGYVTIVRAGDAEEVYRQPIELSNISSASVVRAEIERYTIYLERWAAEQAR
jgi:tetratricopeptide (TPR) repeat protein